MRITNLDTGAVLAEHAEGATSLRTRFFGLMGRAELPAGTALVLQPCNSIHMFFMRFAIDAVHLDRAGVVLRCVPDLQPWRIGPIVRHSHTVIELPAGTLARTGTEVGHRLQLS